MARLSCDSAKRELEELFADSSAPLKVLPVDPVEARRGLLQIQVTARSALGSMALNCGGLIIDDGWVRVFALNSHDPAAHGRPGVPGQMTYFAPEALEWEAMEMGHSAWVSWLLSGRLD